MSAIDEVKQRTDIVEVVSQYASLKKAGRNLTALCPFHSENHPSFFVYPEQQSWHCFGACNTGGDVFSFVMRKEGIGFGEALRLLAQRAGVNLPSRTEREGRKEEKEELYQINEAAALYFHNLLLNSSAAEKALSYAASRGFSPQTVAAFQLGFSLDSWEALKQYLVEKGHSESTMLTAGLLIEAENGKTHDRFRGKLMFPIHDIKGRTIGFGARALDDSMPKYVNSPQTPTFDKSSSLYGIDLAAATIRQHDTAIIMEGYMDVITAHQNGVNNAVASMGTAVTETQVNALKKLSRNLILALDADAAGEEAMLRGIGYENTMDAEVRVIILPEGKDPDDVIKEDVKIWQDFVDRALPIVDYTFNIVTSHLDLTTAKDQKLTVEKLAPIVAEIKDTTRQSHYIQKLASLTKKDVRTTEAVISRMKHPPVRRKTPEPKSAAVTRALRPLVSSPLETDCLALLLQHPELKDNDEDLLPEYFTNSETREIFASWQQVNDLSSLRETLDLPLLELLDTLINKSLPSNNVERRYADYSRRLRERFLKNRAAKISEILALEAESGDIDTGRASLEEEGVEISTQLRELDARKNQKRSEMRR
jgi:DNA primase